jgi:hypothetical protein
MSVDVLGVELAAGGSGRITYISNLEGMFTWEKRCGWLSYEEGAGGRGAGWQLVAAVTSPTPATQIDSCHFSTLPTARQFKPDF